MSIALFNNESDALKASDKIQLFLTENRPEYNAELWSNLNKSDSAELWAVPFPIEEIELDNVVDIIEEYPEGWTIVEQLNIDNGNQD